MLQPIWVEGDESFELNSKALSKFPSLFPVRVSPNLLTNQIPSQESDTSPNVDVQEKVTDTNNDTYILYIETQFYIVIPKATSFNFLQNSLIFIKS